MATPMTGWLRSARDGSGGLEELGKARGAWDGSGGMKIIKNAERYANNHEKLQKCGTVCKRGWGLIYSTTLLPLFIIWQIMKSGKSVGGYAKVGGG